VDIPILFAQYDDKQARRSLAMGKSVWVYNGLLPRTGTFLLDADAVSPRVNGWLSAIFGIPRWFYWESTYWYGRHGNKPIDPFADAESFHNEDGDWANGDGVLVYPGRQQDGFAEHSLDFDGVVASIRLKNWRRGLQDAVYYEMAKSVDPARADAVARWLIPTAFAAAEPGRPPSWGGPGERFFAARRALLAIVLGGRAIALGPIELGSASPQAKGNASNTRNAAAALAGLALAGGALVGGWSWRRLSRARGAATRRRT
jgi:hypothetical protein